MTTPMHVAEAIRTAIRAQRPAFLWGAPGIGKSAIVAQVAKEDGLDLRDIRASQTDPVDWRGLPTLANGKTTWATPDFLPTEGKGILFLDELNNAPPLVQAGLYQLLLDRCLGDYTLPKEWFIIAAGNRQSDRATAGRLSTAAANRLIHIDVDISLPDWCKWAIAAHIQTPIVAFLRFRPELLHNFDAQSTPREFASPRSWHIVSDIMTTQPSPDIELDMYRGAVGEGPAAELVAFLRIWRTLPNPDQVLMDPMKAKVPTDPATLYALCGALARKASDNNADRLFQYAGRLPAEFSVLMVRDSIARCATIASTKAFIDWTVTHQDVLI